MHVEEVVHCHEANRVDQAFLVQKTLHAEVGIILSHEVVKLNLIEILLRVPEFVGIGRQVPLRKVVLQEILGKLKRLVINQG